MIDPRTGGCAALCTLALLLTGCSNGGGGLQWGEEAGSGGGRMGQAAALPSGESLATGGISGQLIGATVEIIARRDSTARQRETAGRRATAYMRIHRPASRYLAVDTASDTRTSRGAGRSVILFDSKSKRLAGKNVYDLSSPPPLGAVAQFGGRMAQYIGPGI